MLVTWIRDVYRQVEAAELRAAIDDLASPTDDYGFASNGVYIFFDPTTFETLYIGLARDLSERFAQHNGLVSMAETGCKVRQIRAWFKDHDSLGYAMFVQSSLDQISVHRQTGTRAEAIYDEESATFWDYGDHGLDEIKTKEGILISAFRAQHGRLPTWNKINGARQLDEHITPGGYNLLVTAAGEADSLLVSRKTIRQLSTDPTFAAYEDALHAGRIEAVLQTFGAGMSSPIIWNALLDLASRSFEDVGMLRETVQRMVGDGYLELPPPVPGDHTTPGQFQMPRVTVSGDEDWHLMWTDEGAHLNEQMGIEVLRCITCRAPATILESVNARAAVHWCTQHAELRGAPARLISLARE